MPGTPGSLPSCLGHLAVNGRRAHDPLTGTENDNMRAGAEAFAHGLVAKPGLTCQERGSPKV
eukprot:6252761-Alexandrium_andersonii.AAC.1